MTDRSVLFFDARNAHEEVEQSVNQSINQSTLINRHASDASEHIRCPTNESSLRLTHAEVERGD